MSNLSNKILSYSPEVYYRFNQAYTTTPTNSGSVGQVSFGLVNEAPIYQSTGGIHGEGSWIFNHGNGTGDLTVTRFAHSGSSVVNNTYSDVDYSTGFWFKTNYTLQNSLTHATSYSFYAGGGGTQRTFTINLRGDSANSSNKGKLSLTAVGASTVSSSIRVDDQQWHYVAITAQPYTPTGSVEFKLYLDGTYIGNSIPSYSTPTASTTFGSVGSFSTSAGLNDLTTIEFSDFYIAPKATIDAAQIAEIYAAGSTVNITITADPIITTALMTNPVISILNYDTNQNSTAMTADAIFANANGFGVINSINSTLPLTASAEMLDHFVILGIGVLYPPQPLEASAILPMPPFFGTGDKNILPDVLTASALYVEPTLNIQANFYALVRSDNPSLFITDPSVPLTSLGLVNHGFDNWGYGFVSSSIDSYYSPGQFGAIGNKYSIRPKTDIGTTNLTFGFNDTGTATIQSEYFQIPNSNTNDFTIEFWYYPLTYDSNVLEKIIGLGDTEVLVSQSEISLQMNSDEIPNDGILVPFTHTVTAAMNTNEWNHIVITGNYIPGGGLANLTSQIYLNGAIKGTKTFYHVNASPTSTGLIMNSNNGDLYGYFNGIALYKYVLTNTQLLSHYNFVATSSPNRLIASVPFESAATLVDPTFITVTNKNFPATTVTASALIVNPTWLAAVGDGYDAELIEVSATFVNPYFYGNPDAIITHEVMTASADTPQNVYRLDTAYYSYVQTNIAPIRYVTFDNPNPNLDWGSDNDFAQAVPFVIDGTVTTAIDGLNNNSLLSNGTNYQTNGIILKESEWDDDWGTTLGAYHSSYWIKRHPDDTSSNGIRIIQSVYSPLDGSYGILYQQDNLLKVEMFNGTNYFTAVSSINVNVFDYNKHHIVVNFRKTGSNHFFDIYVNKQLVITQNVGPVSLILKNSNTYLPPNTETNNKARMSVGALIVPIQYTSLPFTPTPIKMYIDDVYWAATSITQTGVNNLYAAMPYKNNINVVSDTFLITNSLMNDAISGAGNTITSSILSASALMINPLLTVDFDKIINATAITASAEAVEPFSVIGDSVTEINFTADIFLASSEIGDAVQRNTISANPMNATARIPASKPAWYDPYRALIIQQSLTYPAGNYYGFKVGDID